MASHIELTSEVEAQAIRLAQAVADAEFWQDRLLKQAEREHEKRVTAADDAHDASVAEARRTAADNLAQAEAEHAAWLAENEQSRSTILSTTQTDYATMMRILHADAVALTRNSGLAASTWDDNRWELWQPGEEERLPRFGRVGQFHETIAAPMELPPGAPPFQEICLPAFVPLLGERNIVFKAQAAGKAQAIGAMQSLILRLLALTPPGKLRFTLLDPMGLGQNVAGFMYLADFSEQLVSAKAWTESAQIDQQLGELTAHMEDVIQKYLRNQYASMEEFNAGAGEVAEPYRVLVVFDFPSNFSEQAQRRLLSICQNGPRCGVYTLILQDTSLPRPQAIDMKEIDRTAIVIAHNGRRFAWQEEGLQSAALELDAPPNMTLQRDPEATLFGRILTNVGRAAKDAGRVEVPFEKPFDLFPDQLFAHPEDYPGLKHPVDPRDPSTWWTASSAEGLTAFLGRVGAQRVQCLSLGQGTSHHVLLAGRTGSGKSSTLHSIITGLSVLYSPEELELYLIDFKKGVEFKAYATYRLPHARVIAIESEREFGLSVLRGLDAELKRRADLFRLAGVDDLPTYREKTGRVMPRILLLVDEFQEFFTENDAVAAGAAQILDRLARQGRSFGVHLLLASQSLAGVFAQEGYSLARSTRDQMQVRIALQSSEADSRLILAEDNMAARSLNRPGAAIYNAHSGQIEGNNPFQVAWLPDDTRDRYLEKLNTLAQDRGFKPVVPQRVFEGNAPAEVRDSVLESAIAASTWPSQGRTVPAYLGESSTIMQPVSAQFRRRAGSNLLVVGRNDEIALAMMLTGLVSLAAFHAPAHGGARFFVLDFTPPDGLYADRLARLAEMLPRRVRVAERSQMRDVLSELTDVVEQRAREGDAGSSPIYLVVFGLHWARDLRIGGLEGQGNRAALPNDGPSLPERFATILRDGPPLGVHSLIWCDTLQSLTNTLSPRSLRDVAMRVVLQMGAQDSRTLVDTEMASRLGVFQALYSNEDEGRLEKFRPYALPAEYWLAWAGDRLRDKAAAIAAG
jgi:DNA segregation ATPase FtsK/SpoIIIE, S-DNA-T family